MNDVDLSLSHKINLIGLFCAMLVVGIHVPDVSTGGSKAILFFKAFLSHGVCRMAVPWFFLVSGFFLGTRMLETGWYETALRKRVVSLLVPYVSICMLYVGFAFALGRDCGGWLTWLGLDWVRYPSCFPLWFVRSLLLLVLVSPVIKWISRLGRVATGVFLLLLIANYCLASQLRNTSPIYRFVMGGLSPVGLLYFSMGVIISIRKIRFNIAPGRGCVLLVFGTLAFLTCAYLEVFTNGLQFIHPMIIQIGIGASILGLLACCPDRDLPFWLQGCAFPIYLLHLFVIVALESLSIGGYVVSWILGILMPIFLANVLMKHLPRVAACLFGGRAKERRFK